MVLMTALETAARWGISPRQVDVLCDGGQVDGAQRKDDLWLIPLHAQNPAGSQDATHQPQTPAGVKPFLKWAGGKAQILDSIRAKYPPGLGKSITKYAEPFVGGGAVLFDVLSNYNLSEIYISDMNRELILVYQTVRDKVEALLSHLRVLEEQYTAAGSDTARKELYYDNRKKFNTLKLAADASPELAALFSFLNKTCFNGLYRVNTNGEYNVPQGRYKNPRICDEPNLRAVSNKLQRVRIVCGDYRESFGFIDKNTFAYFDPPYRPLTSSSNFTSYTQARFGDTEQIALARFVDEVSDKGAFVVVSNSDPKNADPQDDFFDALYARHKISRIGAGRAINSVSKGRGKISELLISNF